MNADKLSWNFETLQDLFPLSICKLILSVPIFIGEQDELRQGNFLLGPPTEQTTN